MTTLQVQITTGPQAGARLQLNTSPVSFGRSAENTLVIDAPVVSRQHGELMIDDAGQWVLVNHSTNGTRVGRKKATKKPVPLTDGVPITIGDTEVFRVYLVTHEQSPAPADAAHEQGEQEAAQQPADRAPGAGLKGRSKLWIILGAWFVLCIGAMIFFATLDKGEDNTNNGPNIYIPGNEIAELDGREAGVAAIKRLLVVPIAPQDPNPARYTTHLNRANDANDGGKLMLYEAYKNYQKAKSYSDDRDNPFDAQNRLKYDNILNELSQIIYDEYMLAERLYRGADYKQSRAILDDLRQKFYPGDLREGEDKLSDHIKRLQFEVNRRVN